MKLDSTQRMYDRMRREAQACPQAISSLQLMLTALGCATGRLGPTIDLLLRILSDEPDEPIAARKAYEVMSPWSAAMADGLRGRAQQVFGQIKPFLQREAILDFGCGDGRISTLVREHINGLPEAFDMCVHQYDVSDYRCDDGRLPMFTTDWDIVKRWKKRYLAVLALTVLHHCDDPDAALRMIRDVGSVGVRIIAIESVVSEEMLWAAQAFVDWLYNRGMHPGADIPVPGNFRTAKEWITTFEDVDLFLTDQKPIGVDLPIVPEHHHLIVACND